MSKRGDGRETWQRLREWDKSSSSAERLGGHLLRFEGFESVDPIHPLGGPDGGKDLLAVKDGRRWISAVYFPRGQQPFSEIQRKFEGDLRGVERNNAYGMVFITNQELRSGERESLERVASPTPVLLLHLERIASILDTPFAYGVRLDFLDIEMTREEQLAFFEWNNHERDRVFIEALVQQNRYLTDLITGGDSYPRAWLPPQFDPKANMLGGTLVVDGNYPLLDVVLQVKMPYLKKGARGSIGYGWKDDVSVAALYPRSYFRLPPWRVDMELDGQPLRAIDIHVRARNGWFVLRTVPNDLGGGYYGTQNQILYEVLGDELQEDSWRKIRELPGWIVGRVARPPSST